MKTLAALLTAAALLFGTASASQASFEPFSFFGSGQPKIVAKVSISEQLMYVTVTNRGQSETYVWKVSTGKTGFETPTGSFKARSLDIDHVSKTYDDAPMPYAVFFTGGYAIHATQAVGRLGTAASHGCVRLAPENAAAFFKLVSAYGKWNTRIVITG